MVCSSSPRGSLAPPLMVKGEESEDYNEAQVQLAIELSQLDEFKEWSDLAVMLYVSDATAREGAPPPPSPRVDLESGTYWPLSMYN